jgi:hypothetical protein
MRPITATVQDHTFVDPASVPRGQAPMSSVK